MAPGSPLMVFKEAVDYAEEEGKAWKTETAYCMFNGDILRDLMEGKSCLRCPGWIFRGCPQYLHFLQMSNADTINIHPNIRDNSAISMQI